ncbi:Eukaryotic translation initiation factor 3 subunit B [Histomonas meleagridis]|uniref:Eukaryotic translation initiation factor 3 subunit B n=1 Tax=Histomonas meleagridis TaxID=135588 RepID=UPI00355AAC81|nr:Eukaryotic translation initiation factor 3 subunit B [Histomonas meleagridis]KAH0805483.1 Eukaryotic translation initiation factor 3 subunit B [Histomonas meleagridis]
MSRLTNIVVCIGLPKTTEANFEKFKKYFLSKILIKFIPTLTIDNIELPSKDGQSTGIAFIKCTGENGSSQAHALITGADHAVFDAKTRVRFMSCETFEKYLKGSDKPVPLVVEPCEHKVQHFSWYLVDERLYDQIVYLTNKLPHAYWFNPKDASLTQIDLPNHLQSIDDFKFSTDGSFLIGKSGDVLKFYTGENWIHFSSIQYQNIKDYIVSPCGRFLLCKALPQGSDLDNIYSPHGASIYDILKSSRVFRFPLHKADYNKIQFGHGSSVLTMVGKELRVFSAPAFKEPKVFSSDIDSFSPSISSPYVFTFRKEREASPPRIAFYSITDGKMVHTHASYNAAGAKAYWHPNKALCAVVIETPVKGAFQSSLTIFDLENPNKVGTFNIQDTKKVGTIENCSWDPKERRISVIIETSQGRLIHLYEITTNTTRLAVYTASCSELIYSPAGRFAVAHDINNGSSLVQFYDMDSQAGIIKSLEISAVESLQWDPNGAFVMANSSRAVGNMSGFAIYLFDGTLVLKEIRQGFKKGMWRPRVAKYTEKDVEAVKDKVDEVYEKYGKFGAADPKVRKEEQHLQKIEKVRNWMKFNRESVAPYRIPQQKQNYNFEIQFAKNFEEKEE